MTAPIMSSVCVGSIVAYAGNVDPEVFEPTTGWMLCDGRLLNRSIHAALFEAIGFAWGGDGHSRFNIPDLRGYFLRGVDERGVDERKDPDSGERTENNPGGNQGPRVGTLQNHASALPTGIRQFDVSQTGSHQHGLDFEIDASRDVGGVGNTVAFPYPGDGPTANTRPSGQHAHSLSGGDKETRPINAYVNWIICFKSVPTTVTVHG